MKGQVFLLTAVIIIAVLVTLRSFATVQHISSEKDILDVSLENLAFRNIENEIKDVVMFSSATPQIISDNAIDFLNFTRTGSYGHSLDLHALFVGVLANSTNQTMNITIVQFLHETNLNLTIKLNTSSAQINSTLLNDTSVWINNFTFTKGETYNLTVSFPEKSYEENVTVETKTNKDTYTAFYDLQLISERAIHSNKIHQKVKIS